MAYSGINSEDSLVQATFARHLEEKLGWDSIYAWNQETFGLAGTLGRTDTREVVLTREPGNFRARRDSGPHRHTGSRAHPRPSQCLLPAQSALAASGYQRCRR